jgi:hypothetical protein
MNLYELTIAKEALENDLRGQRDFLGAGIGKNDDGYIIVVHLRKLSEHIKKLLLPYYQKAKLTIEIEGKVYVKS